MKKQQLFALFLATCLLSSEIPEVHASQEDSTNQENASSQETLTKPEDPTNQADASGQETPTKPDDSTNQEDSSGQEAPTEPDDSTNQADSSGQETPTKPDDSTNQADSSRQEAPTEPDDSTNQADSSEQETPTKPDDSTNQADSSGQEAPTEPDDSTNQADSSGQETPTEPDDSTNQADSSEQEAPTEPDDSINQEDSSGQETPTEQIVQEDLIKQEKTIAEFSIEPLADGEVPTYMEAYARMITYQTKEGYTEGAPWTDNTLIPGTNSNTYRWNGGPIAGNISSGTGCAAFSFILSDAAFGSLSARTLNNGTFTFSDVKVGDILRINNNSHSVIVLRVGDDSVEIAEGNYNSAVHWGRMLTKEDVEDATYLVTRYPEGYNPSDGPDANEPIEGAQGTLEGGLAWKVTNSGRLVISGTGEMPDFTGPDDQPWKDFNDNIQTIVIEDGVTKIGNSAFYGSKAFSVSISGSVETIGSNAFYGSSLSSITIPSSVKTIEESAFRACEKLVSATVSDGVETIGQNAFRGCKQLKSAELPASVGDIGTATFYDCKELKSVKFAPSNNTVTMGEDMFGGCWNLTSVTLPSKANQISTGMFTSCISLFSINIPQGVETIGERAFASCSQLTKITIPDGVTQIGRAAFSACSSLTKAYIPSSVTQIMPTAFSNCGSLTDIYFTGTQAQWDNISKMAASDFSGKTIHCNANLPYTVTVTNGTGSGDYEVGATVTIETNVPEEKVFDKWECDNASVTFASATSAKTTFTMPEANVTVTATYKDDATTPTPEETYTVTVTNGTGSGKYKAGATVTIEANSPSEGKAFDKWINENGNVTFEDEKNISTTFIMPKANVTVTATYKEVSQPDPSKDYTVTVTDGKGSGNYNAGDIVSIEADPAPEGKVFDKWECNNASVTFASATSASTTFTMPEANVTVTATYKDDIAKYAVTVNDGEGSGNYNAGDTVSIKANPAPEGKVFDKWTTDSDITFASATSANTTFIMPEANVTVTATYKEKDDSSSEVTKPQKVTISKTSAELGVEETLDLEAQVVPNTVSQDIVWSIDNEKQAELTVDKSKPTLAKITAKAPGTVTVTAKSKLHPELSATCVIEIKGNASNLAVLENMIAKISAINYNVSGKTVKTKTQAQNWIKEKIEALKLTDIMIDSIDITDFTPAESKEKGKFVFTVTLSTGEGKDKVTLTSSPLDGILSQTTSSSSGSGHRGSSSSKNKDTKPEENNKNEDIKNENLNNINNINNTTSNTPSKNVSIDKFVDVSSHWAADSIQFVIEKGYFAGTSETSFSPDVPMTRAMVVSVLGRVANVQGNLTTKFADVNQSQYYAPFIGWALENGIATGVSETEFNPDANVTREQLAVMFSNFMKSQGYAFNAEKEVSFTDNTNISPWAVESVTFMVKYGILNGRTDGSFDPKGVATRAEVATVLKLFLEKANK